MWKGDVCGRGVFPVQGVTAPKTSAERTAKRRAGLAEKRWELSPPPHPDDRPAIKAYAAKLARKRAKLLAPPRAG